MPGSVPNTFNILWHFIPTAVCSIKDCFHPHFLDEETQAPRSKLYVKAVQLVHKQANTQLSKEFTLLSNLQHNFTYPDFIS